MPSLLGPTSANAGRSYTPLADEVNPPFGNTAPAPTVTRNGTIVYGQRVSSASSSHSSSDGRASPFDPSSFARNGSEETLSPAVNGKGKGRALVDANGYPVHNEADIGELKRVSSFTGNAKGKERMWDEEMGKREVLQPEQNGVYPPVNEVEEDERRIQDNLARFAARDMARRRAARTSRALPSSPTPDSPGAVSATSSFMRRPFSVISSMSSTDSKRNSIMGLMGGMMASPKPKDTELPIANENTPRPHLYNNPYVPANEVEPSPSSPTRPSPFADPSPDKHPPEFGERRASLATSGSPVSPPLHSPTDAHGPTYGYAGAAWRGGGGGGAEHGPQQQLQQRGGEKWWHALCAWGSDLDGGHGRDDNNGRTNPFE